ncbi:MAG: hypothetical protein ABIC04_01440, partial [Nanoarchaeota archaeon]
MNNKILSKQRNYRINSMIFIALVLVLSAFVPKTYASENVIDIKLEYENDSFYDEDNDGIETIEGIIDFTIKNSMFGQVLNQSKLCTRWKILSLDTDEATVVCYGSTKCCNFVDLAPVRDSYDDSFYLNYGGYGATFNNLVSCQIIYLDYSLDPLNPYSNIYYSNWTALVGAFIKPEKVSLYTKIKIFVKDRIQVIKGDIFKVSARLSYDNDTPLPFQSIDIYINKTLITKQTTDVVGYFSYELNTSEMIPKEYLVNITFPGQITQAPQETVIFEPSFNFTYFEIIGLDNIKPACDNIPDIIIYRNQNFTLNLSKYCYDASTYSYDEPENITVILNNDRINIIPQRNFVGLRNMHIVANNSINSTVSNTFAIYVKETAVDIRQNLIQAGAEIGKPVKWIKIVKIKNLEKKDKKLNVSLKLPEEARNIRISEQNTSGVDVSVLVIANAKDDIEINLSALEEKKYGIVYETAAPSATENIITEFKKQVTVKSSLHYEDVLVYSNITEAVEENIRLYHLNNDTRKRVSDIVYVDQNNNSLIDRIEWKTNLSTEIFEIIVLGDKPSVKIYREQAGGVGINKIMAVNFVVWNNNSADISDITIVDEFDQGWSIMSKPVNSTVQNNTIRIPVLSLGPDELVVINYTIKAPLTAAKSKFIAYVNYSSYIQNISSIEVEVNKSKAFFENHIDLYDGDNVTTRTMAVNTTYTAVFTVKNIGFNKSVTDYETFYTWKFNSSIWDIDLRGISKDCGKRKIIDFEGLKAVQCSWQPFDENEIKQFTVDIRSSLNSMEEYTKSNTTYDPPGKIENSVLERIGAIFRAIFQKIVSFFKVLAAEIAKGGILGRVIGVPTENVNLTEELTESLSDEGEPEIAAQPEEQAPAEEKYQPPEPKGETTTYYINPPEKIPFGSKKKPKEQEQAKVWITTLQNNLIRVRNVTAPDELQLKEKIGIKDSSDEPVSYKIKYKKLDSTKYDVEFNFENRKIKNIQFKNLDIGENQTIDLKIDDVPKEKIKISKDVKNSFAIDPSNLNFTNATMTVEAKGTELWKCRDWNFSTQSCYGEWKKIMDIMPGEDYNITLSAVDPGYAETGVASINTKKSIYHPGETAEIIIVVLDIEGHLVADSDVTVFLTAPDNTVYRYTTSSGDILETSKGIYELDHLQTSLTGNYSMVVSALSEGVNNSMESYFVVKDYYEFDILRETPVTTDPWKEPINSSIRIVSYTDSETFNFSEVLPGNFTLVDDGSSEVKREGNKIVLTWEDLVNGSSISYSARPPLRTPDLYEIGPAKVYYNSMIFEEARAWYLAVDPVDSYYGANFSTYGGRCAGTSPDSGTLRNTVLDDNSNYLVMGTLASSGGWGGDWSAANKAILDIKIPVDKSLITQIDIGWNGNCVKTSGAGTTLRGAWKKWGGDNTYIEFTSERTCDTGDGTLTAAPITGSNIAAALNDTNYIRIAFAAYGGNKACPQGTNVYHDQLYVTVTTMDDLAPAWVRNLTYLRPVYSPTKRSYFNISWNDTVGVSTVWFESNFSGDTDNYSMNRVYGNANNGIYNYSVVLPAGDHYWKVWANDTKAQWNKTPQWRFRVLKAESKINLTLDYKEGNLTIDEDNYIAVNGSILNGDRQNIQIYLNDSLFNDGPSPISNYALFSYPGHYNFTLIYETSQNYSANRTTYLLNVTDITAPNVTLDSPVNKSFSDSAEVTFYFNVSDASKITGCILYVEGLPPEANESLISKSAKNSITYPGLPWGDIYWYVNCTDDSPGAIIGHSEKRLVKVDPTAPNLIAYLYPTPANNSIRNVSIIKINASYTENYPNNPDKAQLFVNGTVNQSKGYSGGSNKYVNFTVVFPDGVYNFSVFMNDTAGGSDTLPEYNLIIDTIKPKINFTGPTPGNSYNQSINNFTVNVTHVDANPDDVVFYLNNIKNKTKHSSNGYSNVTIVGLQDGTYTYYVWMNDTAKNTNATETRTIRIDTKPPLIYLEYPSNDSWNNKGLVSFRYNVSDAFLGVSNCSLVIDDKLNKTNTTIVPSASQYFNISFLNSLGYSWYINCSDKLNNINQSEKRVIRVDNTYPFVYDFKINDTNPGVNKYVCINLSATDTFSKIKEINATINYPSGPVVERLSNVTGGCGNAGGNVWSAAIRATQDGQYNWTHTLAFDHAGNENISYTVGTLNWSASSDIEINATMTGPLDDFELNESSNKRNSSYLVACNVTCAPYSSEPCQEVYIFVQSNGLDLTTGTGVFINNLDNKSCGTLNEGDSCNQTFNVTVGKTAGGETYEIRCKGSSENAGFDYSELGVNLTINDFPAAGFTYPQNGSYLSGIKILNGSASTDDQNLSIYSFEIDDNAGFITPSLICKGADPNCSFNTSNQSQCADSSFNCYLRLNVTDTDGLSNSTYITIQIDNTPPKIRLNSPSNASWSLSASVLFKYTGYDSSLGACVLYNNDSFWGKNETNMSAVNGVQDITPVKMPDGRYVWNVWCNDSAGNYAFNESNRTINIDTVKPLIEFGDKTADNNTYFSRNYVYVNVTYTENNFNNITFYLYNSSMRIINQTNSSAGVHNINFTGLNSNMAYYYNVSVRDKAGNRNTTKTRKITLDTSVPKINFGAGTAYNNSYYHRDYIYVDVSIVENNKNITRFYLYNSTYDAINITNITNGISYVNFTHLPGYDGVYYYNVTIIDKADLWNRTKTRKITLDSLSPLVALNQPLNDSLTNSNYLMFNYTPRDTNLKNCSLFGNFSGTWGLNQTNTSIDYGIKNNFSAIHIRDGYYVWNVRCYDRAGNYAFNQTNFSLRVDTTAPTLFSLTRAANNTFTINRTPFLNWTIPVDPNFDNYTIIFDDDIKFLSIDHRFKIVGGNATNHSYQVAASEQLKDNTKFYWKVLAYDSLGHNRNSTNAFLYTTDNYDPKTYLVGPAPDELVTSSFSVNFFYNVTDNFKMANCSLIIDGALSGTPDTTITRNTTQQFSAVLTNGDHNWSVNCTDKAGNINQSEIRNISISVAVPLITYYETAHGSNLARNPDNEINLSGTTEAGADRVSITKDRFTIGLQKFVSAVVVDDANFGPNGLLVPASTTVIFSGNFDSTDSDTGYAYWKLEYDVGGGYAELCSVQDDVFVPATEAVRSASCASPASEIYMDSGDTFRLTVYINKVAGEAETMYHDWDSPDNSGFSIYSYQLGDVAVNLTYPIDAYTVNESDTFNATCTVNCTQGWCYDTQVYIQINTSEASWADVGDESGNLVYVGGTNPQVVGQINSSQTVNFTLKGNQISKYSNIRCIATSTYSNMIGSAIAHIIVKDFAYPTIALNNPKNDTWDSDGNIMFYYIPNDNFNISNCSIIINNTVNRTNYTVIENKQNNFSINGFLDGSYSWNINCTDSYGNENSSADWLVNIDSVVPRISYGSKTADNNSYFNRWYVYVNVTVNESHFNVTRFYLYNSTFGLVNNTNITDGTSIVNFTNNLDTNEVYYYNVTHIDMAGNRNSTKTRKITLDSSIPKIEYSGGTVDNDSYFNRDYIYVNVSIVEDNINVSHFYLFNSSFDIINITNITDGISFVNFTNNLDTNEVYYYNVTHVDKAGNRNSTKTRKITLDTSIPKIEYSGGTAGNGSYFNRDYIYVNVSIFENNTNVTRFFLYDSTFDIINITNITDGTSYVNFTNNLDANEAYYYNVTHIDKAGNRNSTKTRKITLDDSDPKVRLDEPINATWSSSAAVSFKYTSYDTNLDACVLYHNDTAWGENETNMGAVSGNQDTISIDLADGNYVWNVFCNDSAKNWMFNGSNLTVYVDTVMPKMEFGRKTADNDTYFNRDYIFVNVSFTENNFDNITFYLYNSSLHMINQTNYSVAINNINFTGLNSNMAYYYNATVSDKAGNRNFTKTRKITLDSIIPKIDYSGGTEDNDSYFNRRFIYVNVTIAENNTNVTRFYLYNSSWDLLNITNKTDGASSVNFTNIVDFNEEYYYNVVHVDRAGNINSTRTRRIILDNIYPKIDYIYPTPENRTNQSIDTVTINATHTEINRDTIILRWNGTQNALRKYSINYSNFTLSNLADGRYSYYVWLNDSAGNYNITNNRTLIVDTTEPFIRLIKPLNNIWRKNSTKNVLFEYNVTDELLSIANCSLIINGTYNKTNFSVQKKRDQNISQIFDSGSYAWRINCSDNVGNENTTAGRLVKVDLSFPALNNPNRNVTRSNITKYVCLNVTISDTISGINKTWARVRDPDNIVQKVFLSDDLASSCDKVNGDGVYSAEMQMTKVGVFNWTYVYANDTAGNINNTLVSLSWNISSIGSLTVNMTYPETNLEINESETGLNYTFNQTCLVVCDDKPQNCSNVWLSVQYNLSGGASELISSSQYLVNYDNSYFCGNLSAGNVTPCNYTFTIRSATDAGATHWNVWCGANSSNVGSYISAEAVNISINDHPVAAFTYPLNGTWLSGIEILNATASTDDQAIIDYSFEIDNNSNFSSPTLICFGQERNCTFNTSEQIQCPNETMSCYLRVNVTDSDWLTNSTYIVIGIDNIGPSSTLKQPLNGTNITSNYYVLNATVSDEGSGVDAVTFQYRENEADMWKSACNDPDGAAPYNCSWNVLSIPDGSRYQIRVYANDSENNIGNNHTRYNITIDRKKPKILLEGPADNSWNKENVTFYYNVTDETSYIVNCSLELNGTTNKTNKTITKGSVINFTVYHLIDGHYSWNVSCIDSVGNRNISASRFIRIDNTPPAMTIDLPANLTNISAANYIVNASIDDGSGIGVNSTLFYYRAGGSLSWNLICVNYTDNPQCVWNTGGLSEGKMYEVRAYINDSLNNIGFNDTRFNISIDRTEPMVRLLAPGNLTQDVDGNNVVFVYNVTDSTLRITNCSLIINGSTNMTNYSITKGIEQNFTRSGFLFGNYIWNVTCTDFAGNKNYSETRTLIVAPDIVAPTVNITSPKNDTTLSYNDVTFHYTVNDSLSDISNCSIMINGTFNMTNSTLVSENETNSFFVLNFQDGDYLWNVTCTDASVALNKGESKTYILKIREATSIAVNVLTDKEKYESVEFDSELANITILSEDKFGNKLSSNLSVAIIRANTQIPWWNTSYSYRQFINITNKLNGTLFANYTINYTLNTLIPVSQNKMNADGSDLRIVYFNNETNTLIQLDRIISNINTADTYIYFKTQKDIIRNGSDSHYYVYYGNKTPGEAPFARSNIYFYYDEFDTNTLSQYNTTKAFDNANEDPDDKLSHSFGTIQYSSEAANQGKSIRREEWPIRDVMVEIQQQALGRPGGVTSYFELGARINGSNYYYMDIPTAGNILPAEIGRYINGAKKSLNSSKIGTLSYGKYYRFRFIVYDLNDTATALKVFVNNTQVLSYNDTNITHRLSDAGGFGAGSVQFIGLWDNVTVKRYVSDEPTSENGSEEAKVFNIDGEAGPDGIFNFVFNATNQSYDNYSIVSLARKPPFYNNGYGKALFEIKPDTTPPKITLSKPVNNHNISNEPINFNWTADDLIDNNLSCNLTINGVVNVSDFGSIDEEFTNYSVGGFLEGVYQWNVTCIDDFNNSNTSETRTIIVDRTEPAIVLNGPLDHFNTSYNWVLLNYTVTDNTFKILNCSLYLNNALNMTNASVRNGSYSYFNISAIPEGNFKWNISCYDRVLNHNRSATKEFRIDTTSPSILNVSQSHSVVFNFKNLTIYVNVTDNITIGNLLIEGNWTGIITNYSVVNYFGTSGNRRYNYTIDAKNLSSGQHAAFKIFTNDSLGNIGFGKQYNFSVVRSVANITIDYPTYFINRYENETFWVNASTTALNGSINTCNLSVDYNTSLTLLISNQQSVGNLSNGSSRSSIAWRFNGTTVGSYIINITSNCSEGDARTVNSVEIEITPLRTYYSNTSYAERRIIDDMLYYHLATDTQVDWWVNESEEYIGFDSSGIANSWFRSRWMLIINNSLILDFSNFSTDVRRTGVDDTNRSFVQFSGVNANHKIRINYTKSVSSNSKMDNLSFDIKNMGDNIIGDVKLKWIIDSFDIGLNGILDNISLTNSTGDEVVRQMGSGFNYSQTSLNDSVIYFSDPSVGTKGGLYWEWNMSVNGTKTKLVNFTLKAGGTAYTVNLTFDFGSLSGSEIKGFDPGAGLLTPDLIQRTGTLDNLESDETGTTYTDVTIALTDNNFGTVDYAMARAGDRVSALNILNLTEMSLFDDVFLKVQLDNIEADPYPVIIFAYNTDNVTVETSLKANYTFTSADIDTWVSINITAIAHTQDGFGYVRVRLAPNGSAIGNNYQIFFSEILFNVTDTIFPNSTLVSPKNNTWSNSENITFICNATDVHLTRINLWHNIDGSWKLNQSKNMTVESNQTSFNVSSVNDNNTGYLWNCEAVDGSNNSDFAVNNYTFYVDTVEPTSAIYFNDSIIEFGSEHINVGWNVSDLNQDYVITNVTYPNGSLLASSNDEYVNFTFGPANLTMTGLYTVKVWVNDSAGNINYSIATFSVVDTTPPNATLISPINASWSNSSNVTFTCNATNMQLRNVSMWHNIDGEWKLNQTKNITGRINSTSFNVSNIPDNNTGYLWNCLVYDIANNSDWGDNNFTLYVDTVKPMSEIYFNDSIIEFGSEHINVGWNVSDLNQDYVITNVTFPNGSLLASSNDEYVNFTFGPANLTMTGLYTVKVWVNDSAGNINYSIATFSVVDTTPPNATLISPINASWSNSSNVTFACNATNMQLRNVSLWHNIDGEWKLNQTKNITGRINSTTFNVSNIPDNNTGYLWNCLVYDIANNSDWGDNNFTLYVDTVKPMSEIYFNDSIIEFGSEHINVGWNVSDLNQDYVITNVTYPNGSLLASSNDEYVNFTFGPANLTMTGLYTVKVWVNDSAGNINYSMATFSVVDTTPPNATLISPINASWSNSSNVTFVCNATNMQLRNISLW